MAKELIKFEIDHKGYIRLKERFKEAGKRVGDSYDMGGKWKAKYYSTGIRLNPKLDKEGVKTYHWNPDKERVTSSEKEFKDLNDQLDDFKKEWLRVKEANKTVVSKKGLHSFTHYFKHYNGRIKNYDTKVKHNSVLSWVDKFIEHFKMGDMWIEQIDREHAYEFKAFLENATNQYGEKSSQKTTDKYFQIFRKVCRDIEKNMLIDGKNFAFPSNTFTGIKLVETDGVQKERLDIAQYDRIKILTKEKILAEFPDEKITEAKIDKALLDRNKFILQLQFGGLRISDFLMLKWSNFFSKTYKITSPIKEINGKLGSKLAFQYIAFKTKLDMKVYVNDSCYEFLLPFLIAELERTGWNKIELNSLKHSELNILSIQKIILELSVHPKFKNRLVFLAKESDNILFKDYDAHVNKTEWRKRIQSIYAPINENLKIVSKWAKLNFELGTHIARHSNAQFMADAGFSAFEVMDALGHKKLATSQQYVKRGDGLDVSDKINKMGIL